MNILLVNAGSIILHHYTTTTKLSHDCVSIPGLFMFLLQVTLKHTLRWPQGSGAFRKFANPRDLELSASLP